MKNIYKSMALAMLMTMGMTSTAFAKIDLKVNVDGAQVTIDGKSDHISQYTMMQTWIGDKKYQIDANETDNNGNFKFKFKAQEDLNYKGRVNIDGELKDFQFSTKKKSISTGGGGGGGCAPSKVNNKVKDTTITGKDDKEILKSLNNKLEKNVCVDKSELTIEKLKNAQVITVNKDVICSKIQQAEKIISAVKDKHKNIDLNKDMNFIPINIDEVENQDTTFKIQSDIVSELNNKNFKLKLSFKDSQIKLDTSKIDKIKSNENLQIKKSNIGNNVIKKIKTLSSNEKIVTPPYNISLYKINNTNKKEDKLNFMGMEIGFRFDSKQFKNISKKSLKINFYDSKENKVKILKSNYVSNDSMVVANIK